MMGTQVEGRDEMRCQAGKLGRGSGWRAEGFRLEHDSRREPLTSLRAVVTWPDLGNKSKSVKVCWMDDREERTKAVSMVSSPPRTVIVSSVLPDIPYAEEQIHLYGCLYTQEEAHAHSHTHTHSGLAESASLRSRPLHC